MSGAGLGFDAGDVRLARAAWSRLAEPEDRAAAAVIQALGPSEALAWLAGGAPGAERHGPAVARAVARWRPRLDGLDPRRELAVLDRLGGRLLIPEAPGWPEARGDLGDLAPVCLWAAGPAAGAVDGLGAAGVAIVGSRACTAYGETATSDIVAGLGERGHAIVSGGAFGIDAAAHRTALAVGATTVAVMAGGIDRLYPAGNEPLLREVLRTGAVVAESPPGSAPRRERFLSRNRLIAALSRATVVVEAGWRSGAQSTARRAAELMRGVGAVPGPVTSAASAGCHRLIREGVATLVTDAAEAAELAGPLQPTLADAAAVGQAAGWLDGLAPRERRVADAMPARCGATADSLARAAGLAPREVIGALGRLERAGLVHREGGAWYKNRPPGPPR
ncbi:MAG: DNA-processing protein DprA [Bifidobacteriaceae bacterium]|jgi:DNA processing protein|nr:DNA-processing protein DprA [Bifidobacteriaceae bacterium]